MTQDWFKLTTRNIYFLFSYYLILLIGGVLASIIVLLHESLLGQYSITLRAILGGISFSLVGSSIFYLRKLYKACINADISTNVDRHDTSRIGVIFYFVLRPIFSVSFSILIILFLKVGVNIITVKEARLDVGFIYLTLFLSFFSGFSSGKFLSQLDNKGVDVITKIFEKV